MTVNEQSQSKHQSLAAIMAECHATAVEKGWWPLDADGQVVASGRNFGEIIALCHTELSESFEEYRKFGLNREKFIYFASDGLPHGATLGANYPAISKPEGIAVELADLLIRIFDNCEAFQIPLEEALRVKMQFNKSRPYRHGGKLA